MVGNEFCILAMGAVVIASVENAYRVIPLRQIAEEFTKTVFVFFFQFRAGCHVRSNCKFRASFEEKEKNRNVT